MRLFVLDLVCAFLVGLTDEFMPLIVRNIINEYVPKQSWALMVKWSIALAVIYVIKFCLNMIITYWGHVLESVCRQICAGISFVILKNCRFPSSMTIKPVL